MNGGGTALEELLARTTSFRRTGKMEGARMPELGIASPRIKLERA